jgi:hypothetical protein
MAEFADRDVDGLVEVAKTLVDSQPVAQVFPADDLARTFQKDLKQLQWLLLNPDFHTGAPQFARIEPDLKGAKPCSGCAPQLLHCILGPFSKSSISCGRQLV